MLESTKWHSRRCFRVEGDIDAPIDQYVTKVALVGAPNAGKSTLLNAMAGQKISAVSQKTNTTFRSKVGYFIERGTQVVMYDTPGLVEKSQYADQKHGQRVESAWNIAGSCDVALLLVDAHRQHARPDPRVVSLIENFANSLSKEKDSLKPKTALVLTKIDKIIAVDEDFAQMVRDLFQISQMNELFCISALRGNGLSRLQMYLQNSSKRSPWLIDTEVYNRNYRMDIAEEIIREKLFRAYYKEIPYSIKIIMQEIRHDEATVTVRALLSVASPSMKTIIIGTKGSAIRSVEKAAQCDLEKIYKLNVRVILSVSIRS
ncbi:hypothetical protein M9434_000922 [Picochlorum sp. BPE23]|nr:hypothetical protein M9434_000922 [Picochlorum sp. BPE23]KAI8111659.1 hypothetical protein M9435_004159 [Picochlorum sp. BPE23]